MQKIKNNLTQAPTAFANSTDQFLSQPLSRVDLVDSKIAYRCIGSGPVLIMLHGFPVSGLTYRHIVPYLKSQFTCYVLDIPGLGESIWAKGMDFHFEAQGRRLKIFIDALDIKSYSILAHDTGATLARLLALIDAPRIKGMVLLNTEIPGHRAPWIPLYTTLFRIPGIDIPLGLLFRWRSYLRTPMAFKNFYFDLSLINDDFIRCYIMPLLTKKLGRVGLRQYLIGFDWKVLDSLQARHAEIKAPVLFIWGKDDATFPIELAKKMAHQFSPIAQLKSISNAKLMPHEERPEEVARDTILFLNSLPQGNQL